MQNYKLTIAYDGTDYHGWQMQANARTIQGELTRVLTLLDHRKVTLHGAGRTDAGVHAEAQVASVFLQRDFAPDQLCDALNGNLNRDLRVMRVEPPVVTTSSTTRTRSPSSRRKPRLSVITPFSRSLNSARTPSARAAS